MGRADTGENGESSSGSWLTRSHLQAGPVWTLQDMFILVNEIAAVEGDCQDALSYQKWTIIAENCTALGGVRNASQCRRKWESLLADFNAVKEWESSSRGNSYWSLECGTREETELPVDFDKDLYSAIDDFTKITEQTNTDTECDSEGEALEVDVLNAGINGPKPKRVKLQSTTPRSITNERKQLSLEEEREKPMPVIDDVEEILATKVMEKTELIHAIIAGVDNNVLDNETSDVTDETLKTERVKCKAEKLIACLIDLTKNLELCDAVKE